MEHPMDLDHGEKTFALMRDDEGQLHATDDICTHGNTHLADGLVKGKIVECPKHNGRFNLKDGSPARAPICRGLATYPIEERNGRIWLNVEKAGGDGARSQKTYNENIRFRDFDIPEPCASVWERQHVFDLTVSNSEPGRRNNYFEQLATEHHNFEFKLALSEPQPEDDWTGHTGFIHEVVLVNYLEKHPNPKAVEFYLCGPPMMIKACSKMLKGLGVADEQIAFDEF